jgi:predicted pyridoxine 5'-phosphate oxidase superfamily flavin-nucleotide-binding protein
MAKLCKEVSLAWENMKGALVFTTVSASGEANSIYATCVGKYDESTLVIADNYFNKTRENILNGTPKGVILFITNDDKAYQIKGHLEYYKEGKIFDFMKGFNSTSHPGHAAVVLKVEEVYKGAEQLV